MGTPIEDDQVFSVVFHPQMWPHLQVVARAMKWVLAPAPWPNDTPEIPEYLMVIGDVPEDPVHEEVARRIRDVQKLEEASGTS